MNDTFVLDWIALTTSALAGLFCFAAAFALASLIRINKGAKLNLAWGFIAFGLVCFGLISLNRTLELLGLPNASEARDTLAALGALLVLIGAVYGHRLYRNLLK